MKIVVASRNRHKLTELQALLSEYIPSVELLSLDDVGFEGDIVENGTSFEENAYIKARAAASTGYIGLGDDSGLSVRALNGAPGIYSARYAGEHGDDAANNRLLLKQLEGKTDRAAEFVCVLACVFPQAPERSCAFRGSVEGRIIDEYRGKGGFGYDPLFFYEPLGRTFAELDAEEKNSVSHRNRAVKLFAEALKKMNID